jgi:prepilin-type N-terminal cleavage/methylation domain-containing protein
MTTRFRRSERGFTLIEVIITLCVFVLLAGAVFGIFSATLESVSSLQDNQTRNDQVEALGGWLKQQMLDLPANGTIASYRRDTIPFHVAGIVWGAGEDLQALDLQMQPNGEYTLRLTAYQPPVTSDSGLVGLAGPQPIAQFMIQVQLDEPSLTWRTLVRDLKSADWRFLQYNQTQWQDIAASTKPILAELTFQPASVTAPVTDDFWIPPTQVPATLAVFGAPPAVSSNP